ncbi:MAG: DMT family transporter [Chlamydiales bacterium]|nr:DMT family transporter [Chlamydiales bacterium]
MIMKEGVGKNKAAFIAIGCAFIFAIRLCIIKATPVDNAEILLFYRFLFDFILLAPLFYRHRRVLKTQRWNTYLVRSVLVMISIYCSTYGVQHLALADAVLLQYTFPLFTALLLWIFYGKKVSKRAVIALWAGFGSVFFLLQSKADFFHVGSFFSLSSAVAAALLAISLHELVKTEHILSVLFHCTWIPGCMSLFFLFHSWESISFPVILTYCIPSSMLGVTYQYFIAKAYSYAPAHIVAGFSYFCVFFSTLFGMVFWKESPTTMQIAGSILIIGSCVLMMRENGRLQTERVDSSNAVE